MAEVAERDPLGIRRRILKEYRKVQAQIETNPKSWRKLSFEAHKKLCYVLRGNSVDYPEFEFWFSRFVQRNFDLNYDRSSDPKTRSFLDLPLDVFENIGEYLELEDRMRLRNVCKDIRAHVDNWYLKLEEIWYSNAENWGVCQAAVSYWVSIFEQNNIPYCFHWNPISFLMSVLKHPQLQLETLTIREDEYWKDLVRELDESNWKLHVKNVEFPYCEPSSKIDLHFMIPGVLEEIKMDLVNPTREELYEFVESEQCQKAKMVHIESWTDISRFPIDALYNCPRFTLRLYKPADGLKAAFLKKLMKKGKVEKCVIYADSQIMKYFNEPKAMVPNFPSLRRYQIPGTNEFYELEYQGDAVRLERKQ